MAASDTSNRRNGPRVVVGILLLTLIVSGVLFYFRIIARWPNPRVGTPPPPPANPAEAFKPEDRLPTLIADVDAGPERRERWAKAVAELKQLGPQAKPAAPALANQLARHADEAQRREELVEALRAIGPGAAPALIDSFEKADPGTPRAALVDALARFGKDAVGPLTEALKSTSPQVRIGAADALAKIGPDAKPALPELKRLSAADDDAGVRRAAAEAVGVLKEE